jgi:hypothetical protein
MVRNAEIGPVTRRPKIDRWNLRQSGAGDDTFETGSHKQLSQRPKPDVTMHPQIRQVRMRCALSQVTRHA